MNLKAFFVDALASALELGIGTPADVLRHFTPDLLATHLPRPLWARLISACLRAPRVDPQFVVETIGVANLCEHIPATIVWGCIAELGQLSIGRAPDVIAPGARAASMSRGGVLSSPPPAVVVKPTATPPRGSSLGPIPRPAPTPPLGAPIAVVPNQAAPPIGDVLAELDEERPASTPRARTPSSRFRSSGPARGLGAARRPQAAAAQIPTVAKAGKRADAEFEAEAVESADWRDKDIDVEDEQLVDWQAEPSKASGDDDFGGVGRKR